MPVGGEGGRGEVVGAGEGYNIYNAFLQIHFIEVFLIFHV